MDTYEISQYDSDSMDRCEHGDWVKLEDVEAQREALKEAWQIINVLTLSHMDEGEPYPKALFWLKEFEHLGYPQPDI